MRTLQNAERLNNLHDIPDPQLAEQHHEIFHLTHVEIERFVLSPALFARQPLYSLPVASESDLQLQAKNKQ